MTGTEFPQTVAQGGRNQLDRAARRQHADRPRWKFLVNHENQLKASESDTILVNKRQVLFQEIRDVLT